MHTHYPDEIVAQAIADYERGLSSQAVSDRYGMHKTTLCRMLDRAGIKRRDSSESKRVYSIDHAFFHQIDSHDKAQILGFIWADGCVKEKAGKSRVLQIVLNDKDTDYLEWIRATMRSSRPIWFGDYVAGDNRRRRSAWFVACHPQIYDDLVRLGVTQCKSLTIGFPSLEAVPERLVGSFICGLFEGDGCIYLGRPRGGPTIRAVVSISASLPCAQELQRVLSSHGVVSGIRTKPTKQALPIALLHIDNVASVMRFYDLIYGGVTFRMGRKHAKFLEFKSRYREVVGDAGQKTYELIERKEFEPENKARLKVLARANGMASAISAHLKSPGGQVYHTNAVKPFCQEHNLDKANVLRLIHGARSTHKGWSLPTPAEIEVARAAGLIVSKSY